MLIFYNICIFVNICVFYVAFDLSSLWRPDGEEEEEEEEEESYLRTSGWMGDSRIRHTTSSGNNRNTARDASTTRNTFPL